MAVEDLRVPPPKADLIDGPGERSGAVKSGMILLDSKHSTRRRHCGCLQHRCSQLTTMVPGYLCSTSLRSFQNSLSRCRPTPDGRVDRASVAPFDLHFLQHPISDNLYITHWGSYSARTRYMESQSHPRQSRFALPSSRTATAPVGLAARAMR